jgi:sugar O-acyltransferase (sialic acid O-acetyltransferase NeuD family)
MKTEKVQIGLIGYGDLGKQIETMLVETGFSSNNVIKFDDLNFNNTPNCHPFYDYRKIQWSKLHFLICLGYKNLKVKLQILNELSAANKKLFTFIHPTCYISPGSIINSGSILYPGCYIDQNVVIRNSVLLNNRVCVSHNSTIGNCSFIAPSVTISGNVKVGECVFIGSGSVLSNNIQIGKNSIIGFASAVGVSLPENTNAIGNPLRILKKNLNIE